MAENKFANKTYPQPTPTTRQYVPLHVHTHYSLLDGHTIFPEYVDRLKDLGMDSGAITDHGNLHGAYEFYKTMKGEGLHPIIGIEAYVAPSPISHKTHEAYFFSKDENKRSDDVSSKGAYTHLLLFAKNNEGLKTLYKLSELSYTEGYYRKPRMSIDLFKEHAKGNLIATTGCPSGEIQTKLRLGLKQEALEHARMMQEIFGKENYFMEIMDHDMSIDLETKVQDDLLEISRTLNIPLIATPDSHYTYPEDANIHEHLLCVSTHSKMNVPTSLEEGQGGKTRFAFNGDGYYIPGYEEMLKKFPEDRFPGAITNTRKLADMCEVTIEPRDDLRPGIPLPEGETEATWVTKEAFAGLKKRLPDLAETEEYTQRLQYELEVITSKNYSGYFLVVSDFIRWAKEQGIPMGPGRGCLTAETKVLTETGYKNINQIGVGDRVYNMFGELETVPEVFEYDVNEDLLQIKAYYGGEGNIMTKDHKVLVSKAVRTGKIGRSAIKYEKTFLEPQWIPAEEIELGDLVVTPKTTHEVKTTSFPVNPNHVVPTNKKYGYNSRAIAQAVGVSRGTVQKFFRTTQPLTTKTPSLQKVETFFTENNLTKTAELERRTVTNNLPITQVEADWDLGWILGVFLSDGYIRKGRTAVGFAQRTSEDENQIPDKFETVFGTKLTKRVHPTRDVTSYTIEHKGLWEFFHTLFPNYEHTAHSKYIPENLFTTTEQFRWGLLEGLWYGDGTHKGKSKYATVSIELAEGVHRLLLSLGLPAGIKKIIREEKRPEFNKYNTPPRPEYSVTTAHNFNLDTITNNTGKQYDGKYTYYRVREINTIHNIKKVYDFTMPETHSYLTDSYTVHNSAAGSLLAYCLDITDADPIRHGLLFERFLNPERESPPDVDVDVDDLRRDDLIAYVKEKYGFEQVAQVVTFGKILAKNAVKDTVRILDLPYALGDQLTKAMPEPIFGKTMPLKDMYDPSSARYDEAGDFRSLVQQENAQPVIDVALGLEGRTRSTGVHAAAVIISNKPVGDAVPMMMRQADGAMITQWDYPTCEGLGLIKYDFLGLRNLGIIDSALKHIKRTRGVELSYIDIVSGPMDDPKVYDLLARGNTLGVFQLDSGGMQNLLKMMKPTHFEDISAVLSLFRPGPMGVHAHTDYALRKNGVQQVDFIHPELTKVLTPILGPTYGLVVYQEQVQLIAREMAGYSLGQADNLRRAMGKKKREVLEAEFIPFSEGCYARGYSKEAVKAVWDVLVPFADYAFNKCFSDRTLIRLADGGVASGRELLKRFQAGEEVWVQSMWSDGEVRPHKVKNIVSTGAKPAFRLKTASGRSIVTSEDHRLLTTRGYIEVKDMVVGEDELIVADRLPVTEAQRASSVANIRKAHVLPLTEAQRVARSVNMVKVNGRPERAEQDVRASLRFKEYQAGLTFEDRSRHQKRINETTDRGVRVSKIMQEAYQAKLDSDPVFRSQVVEHLSRIRYTSVGQGYGRKSFASNGMWCESQNERNMAEFLIENGVEFEMHKPVGRGQCDFYFEGLYWEMDGMDRHISYFERKYGDLPFVVVTPEDYQERIATVLGLEHVRNGDLIVSIEPVVRKKKTYMVDIEMEDDGPKNFVTFKGVVSHNSHTVAYGLTSYMTAFLKANFASEFYAALLSSVSDDTDKTAAYLEDARVNGVRVLPPDVSRSEVDYVPLSESEVLFGLRAVRGIGASVGEEIHSVALSGGPFKSFDDFVKRCSSSVVNKRVLEGLAYGGAFDGFGVSRRALIYQIPELVKQFQKVQRSKGKKMDALFDFEDSVEYVVLPMDEFPRMEKLSLERGVLGLYVSGHPIDGLSIGNMASVRVAQLLDGSVPALSGWAPRGAVPHRIAGVVTSFVVKRTKKGDKFGIARLEDRSGSVECVIFPKVFVKFEDLLKVDGVYQFVGFHQLRDETVSFVVDSLRPLEFGESGGLSVRLKVSEPQWLEAEGDVLDVLSRFAPPVGEVGDEVVVSVKRADGSVFEVVPDVRVVRSPALIQRLQGLLGALCVGRWREVKRPVVEGEGEVVSPSSPSSPSVPEGSSGLFEG